MKFSYPLIILFALQNTSCIDSKKEFSGSPKKSLSINSLAEDLNALPNDRSDIDAFRNSDFLSLHARLVSSLSDDPVTIDNIEISGLKTMVEEMRHVFENLDQRYDSVGQLSGSSSGKQNKKVPASALRSLVQNTYNNLHGVGYLAEMRGIAARYAASAPKESQEEIDSELLFLGPLETDKDKDKCDSIRNGFERATSEQSAADAQCEGSVFGSRSIQSDKSGNDISTTNILTACAPGITERMAAYDLLGEEGCERRLNGDDP